MQNYHVKLQSPASNSYLCKRAADSLDIDIYKKLTHELSISADLETPYNVGLIVGASGSGKTTLAKTIFGPECFYSNIDETKPVIDQFPQTWQYEQCAAALSGIGLTSVPCWIRPIQTLSNGQRARVEAALAMSKEEDLFVIDEWTSVVDRTVGKSMSHCLQKHARQLNKRVVALSCHYDVIEWLQPDWIIDCNRQAFEFRKKKERSNSNLTFTRPIGAHGPILASIIT